MSYIPNVNDLFSILPMLILAGMGLFLLIVQFLLPNKEDTGVLWLLTFLAILASTFSVWYLTQNPGYGNYFYSQVSISPLTRYLNFLYLFCAAVTLLIVPHSFRKNQAHFPEFYALLLFCLTGLMFFTTAYDLMVIFIGLEIFSLCFYILIGMTRNSASSLESAMKYFLLGAFSSAFMLLGIAFLYGGSGSTNVDRVLNGLFQTGFQSNFAKLGFGLFLIGIFFKSALVPFHAWTPDVYEGSLTPITGFMASAGKVCALGLLLVLFQHIPSGNGGEIWKHLVGAVAFLSMTWGNLVAIRQTNLKRILAYSSISHAGYIALGIACGANLEALYYLVTYAVMNLAAFSLLSYMESGEREITLKTISSLSQNSPYIAFALSVLFLSFAGFPPLIGFWSKFFLLQKVAESDLLFHRFLLFAAVANSALAFFYYMNITIQSYMKAEALEDLDGLEKDFPTSLVVGISVAFLLFGILVFQPMSFV
ncbi:NADH-quinone oxidoreductase subunit N [Leptospira ryugenii]|uniref:NADH-quinone oxidoreductase subunit N n=1 Tax=Leptospira ryugenii TaxID=1917863 RepID=A0A2P2DYD3_9LEPT|nr:NADH-quinone oxidoreductase subunit N [Leptospira ryugenii]GBF49610.1 NADH-quinone oxidoreductase subunit N [Leptospira ryugenii]